MVKLQLGLLLIFAEGQGIKTRTAEVQRKNKNRHSQSGRTVKEWQELFAL